jgi:hypothetical protein
VLYLKGSWDKKMIYRGMKKFSNINESKSSDSELEMGIKIESEHCDIYEQLDKWLEKTYKEYYGGLPWSKREFYEKIAKAHLKEIPDYYTRLTKMEKDAEK